MPFVAIIGGFWTIKDAARADAAKVFASQVGGELAKNGLGLVVYNSEGKSLEPYVVSGYVAGLPPGAGANSIRIRCAQSQRDTVKFAEESTQRDLFDRRYFPGPDWEAPFYRSLVEAEGVDGAILMAGGRSTLVAGQIAIARRLPLLAVEHFGGSAEVLWSELANSMKDYPSSAKKPAEMVAWLKDECIAQAEERKTVREKQDAYARSTAQTRKTVWAAGAFLVLLVIVLIGIGPSPVPLYYTGITIAGLIAAGATGALIRSVIWGTEETGVGTSLLLGAVAGFVVGVAYLIPQWIGAPGVLNPTAAPGGGPATVLATDKIQFVSALLVAISAGVGFDTVFTRMKKEAESQPIGAQR
jgi:uncharacterized integral membrane protein